MLKNNSMRYGSDEFVFSKSALLTSKQPLDATSQTAVEGFTITGTEPTNTSRRLIFKVDDELQYFVSGVPTAYPHDGEVDDVLEYGNTAAELETITNIPSWVGKKIYPIIALSAPADVSALPTIKIALKVRTATEVYEKSVETAEFELAAAEGATPRIAEIKADILCTGNASAEIECRLKNDDDVTDESDGWSDWINIAAAKDKSANAVQFRLKYKVTTLDGTDSAKISAITVKHTLGAAAVSGDVAELYSIVQNYETDLKTCYLVVKHKRLIDSHLEAYVNFMPQPLHRELIPIGTSTGSMQTLALAVDGVKDTGIDQTTIQIYADGVPVTGFGYNVTTSEITISGIGAGKAIEASYDYARVSEDWREMIKQIDQQPYKEDGTYMTRFEYVLPDSETDKKLSNIRLRLFRPSGTVENSSLGVASGAIQQFALPHAAKEETIRLNGDWSYNPDSQVITVVAPKDTELIISYEWLGESQEIISWTAGWSAT